MVRHSVLDLNILGHKDLDPLLYVIRVRIWIWMRIRILPSTSKKIKQTLISTLLWLLNDFLMLSLNTDVNVPTEWSKQKIRKTYFLFGILKATDEKKEQKSAPRAGRSWTRIRIRNPVHGSKDPDPIHIKMSQIWLTIRIRRQKPTWEQRSSPWCRPPSTPSPAPPPGWRRGPRQSDPTSPSAAASSGQHSKKLEGSICFLSKLVILSEVIWLSEFFSAVNWSRIPIISQMLLIRK